MLQNSESIKKIHLKDEQKQLIFQDIEEGVLSMMDISKKHKVKYKTIISMRKERQDQAKDIKKYLFDSTYDVLSKQQGPIKKFHIKREIRKFIINPSYYFKTLIINYNNIMKKTPFDENNRKIIDKIYFDLIKKLKENQFDVQIKLKNEKRNVQSLQKVKKQSNSKQQKEDDDEFESQINSSDEPFISQSPFFSDFLIQNNQFDRESENFQQQDSEL